MRVVVTGSDGFIGKHLVKALTGLGHEVVGYDKTLGQDISEIGWTKPIIDEAPDVIVHLAATCSTPGSLKRPYETFRDTVMTTVTVSRAASMLSCPLLLTSSVKARDGLTPYGAAKRMAETWAQEMGRSFDFPVVVNRPGTIYGPGQEGSLESGWVAWFLKAKQEGLKVTINGDGTQMRDLLHVSDYVRLLLLQIDAPGLYARAEPWDVGGGIMNAVDVQGLADHLGLDYEFGPWRYGDALEYISYEKVPGWEPEVYWKDVIT